MRRKAAMIMAGGAGTRMLQSGSRLPKPLVQVSGIELLERNFHQLARFDFDYIAIAVANNAIEIRQFIQQRLIPLAKIVGVELREIVETQSKGNIGAADELAAEHNDLLVVFADNLTTLNLHQVWQTHLSESSDLTLASHLQTFKMPFGQLEFDESESTVIGYTEKPEYEIPVSSAITVLGSWALQTLTTKTPFGLSELSETAIHAGKQVRSFRHCAPWIDVNDLDSVKRAETIVAENFDEFENWWSGAARSITLNIPEHSRLSTPSFGCTTGLSLSEADLRRAEMLKIDFAVNAGENIDSEQLSLLRRIEPRLSSIAQLSEQSKLDLA